MRYGTTKNFVAKSMSLLYKLSLCTGRSCPNRFKYELFSFQPHPNPGAHQPMHSHRRIFTAFIRTWRLSGSHISFIKHSFLALRNRMPYQRSMWSHKGSHSALLSDTRAKTLFQRCPCRQRWGLCPVPTTLYFLCIACNLNPISPLSTDKGASVCSTFPDLPY